MQEAAASGYLEVLRKLESPNAIGRCVCRNGGVSKQLAARKERGVTGKTRIYILAESYLLSC
jgi:hypothetical protein